MAIVTLVLSVDPVTRKRTLSVDLKSDADALPHEHEEQHAAIARAVGASPGNSTRDGGGGGGGGETTPAEEAQREAVQQGR